MYAVLRACNCFAASACILYHLPHILMMVAAMYNLMTDRGKDDLADLPLVTCLLLALTWDLSDGSCQQTVLPLLLPMAPVVYVYIYLYVFIFSALLHSVHIHAGKGCTLRGGVTSS